MKTIVVGYDDTPQAKRALARAAELAKAFDARVIVASVAQLLVGGAIAHAAGPLDAAHEPAEQRDELDHARTLLTERGVAAEYVALLGDPSTEIADLAERRDADLVVVGSREVGLLARLFGLSVSEGVERKASCDVLIVR